jgi:hypothetical protein
LPITTANRPDLDMERGRRAAERCKAAGGTALEAAYAAIEATFNKSHRHSSFKQRCRAILRHGPEHPEIMFRYRKLAQRWPVIGLHDAIFMLERMHQAELAAHAVALRVWGHSNRPRIALMMLEELRLLLRVMRRLAPTEFEIWRDAVVGGNSKTAEAAE